MDAVDRYEQGTGTTFFNERKENDYGVNDFTSLKKKRVKFFDSSKLGFIHPDNSELDP